jgi:predicted TIM-barrel fold metal-dependent hydrolase
VATHAREPIIDCDIHQRSKGPQELFPYLPLVYQERIRLHDTGLSQRVGYPNGGDRGYRSDAWPDDGSPPCSDLEMLQRQHLDPYNVEYAILLGQEYRPIPTLPDIDYATALARAYNDWLIEHWLARDERLKGPPSSPPRIRASPRKRLSALVGARTSSVCWFPMARALRTGSAATTPSSTPVSRSICPSCCTPAARGRA